MTIYWTLKSVPEFSQMTREERSDRWRQVYGRAYRHWQTWAGLLFGALLTGSAAWEGARHGHAILVLAAALAGSVGGFVQGQVQIRVALRYYKDVILKDGWT